MRTTFFLALCFLCSGLIFAQSTFKSDYSTEVGAFVSSTKRMPFWLRAKQYGIVPLTAPVGTLRLGTQGEWRPDSTTQHNRWFVKYSLYAVGNIAQKSQVLLPEAYAMAGLGKLYIYAGRRRESNGITDTLLTSGSYAWSGNALPITQIRVGTNDYAPLKFTRGLFSVNAFYSHGWFTDSDSMQNVYLHAKALYIRFGKPSWKVRFYGGGSHFAQWGRASAYLPGFLANNGKIPSSWDAYMKALWPRQIENRSGGFTVFDTLNRAGNHLGSIDFALEFTLKKSNILIYYQHPWEDQSGIDGGNMPDGLYGIRWKNFDQDRSTKFRITQWTAEFLTTMDQSGPLSATQPRGADDYFNNHQYLDGWTHQQRVIGTPFFTRWMDSDPKWHNLPTGRRKRQMISNNRVKVLHIGATGYFASGITLKALLSQSWNYGRPLTPEPVTVFKQFSSLIVTTVPLKPSGGLNLQMSLAIDKGEWLPAQIGTFITLQKVGLL